MSAVNAEQEKKIIEKISEQAHIQYAQQKQHDWMWREMNGQIERKKVNK